MRALVLIAMLLASAAASRSAADALFDDNFDAYAAIPDVGAKWDLTAGWEAQSGGLVSQGSEHAVAIAFACPEITAGEIRARVRPDARARPGAWAAAGLMLYQGPGHYWRLAVVESPAGQHYCELVEQYGPTWQAQNTGRTALAGEQSVGGEWGFGRDYDLRITVDDKSIRGEVRDGGEVIFARTFNFSPHIPAVRSGRAALEVVAMNARFDDVSASGESLHLTRRAGGTVTAAILSQTGGEEIARLTADALRQAGVKSQPLDPAALADANVFNRGRYDILVLPRSEMMPGPATDNLLAFLRSGGHLIAFGGPPFKNILWPYHGEWKNAQDILEQIRAEVSIIDFAGADLTQWARATSNPQSSVKHKPVPGPDGHTALEVRIGDLAGWETYASPPLDDPFPAGQSVTCFWARGGPRTGHLVVEWNERDGSRWMAAVELAQEWRHYALRAEDFRYWQDSPTKDRGGPGDVFNPQQAERIVFGLAESHSPIPRGEHVYWIADMGAAPSPLPGAAPEPPTLEAMSPWYKVYRTALRADAHVLVPDPEQACFAPFPPAGVSGSLVSPIWRQRGLGAGSGLPGRWVPLIRAATQEGAYRGAVASTYVAIAAPYRGATWTYIGLDPQAVRERWDIVGPVVSGVADRLVGGLLLANGGSDRFSYFTRDGEPPRLVAGVMNIGAQAEAGRVRFAVTDADGRAVHEDAAPVRVEPRRILRVSSECPTLAAGRYRAVCELLPADGSGAPLDRIAHEFSVIAPCADPQFVTVRGGSSTDSRSPETRAGTDFNLAGKKWYPHGLNFWPLYVAGLERFHYWLHWLSPSQYDPEAAERDLMMLESLGANMVSIQYGNVDQAPALNDFLQRAKKHGVYVNVFIPGAHPLAFDDSVVEELVTAARLAENDAVFAYDLAWEPRLGPEAERRQYEDEWAKWIEERYGSIEAAERDWECEVRRIDGRPTGPTDAQLREDGGHRRMVAAYRRFADDLISQGYGRVTRFLRRLDPNHLLGARTGYGGTGMPGVVPVMAFDMISGAAHLDFASPEGWGLSGEWKNFERAGFTTLYGRWASNGKPVFWSEFGYTIYPATVPEKYVNQGEVYRNLSRMVLQSGASGSAGWWYPGGLRVDENSDFGIINPEGTPREAAEELRRFSPRITAPRERPEPDIWITIDRDLDVEGYAGTWERHADEYVAAVRAGKTVGLRTEADGMDSADAPRVAVGGTPLNGHNPPKYLNAEFGEVVLVGAADGKDVEVTNGAVIEVPAGKPLTLRAELINTGIAAWLSPQSVKSTPERKVKAGPVWSYITFSGAKETVQRDVIGGDLPRYGSQRTEWIWPAGVSERTDVTIRLKAEGVSFFGQRLRFTLAPAAGR
ncbi:MAG: hypothetical protein JSV65_12485 [Armatimonadota bacterium]|nr:MAG: hypothetical protein JSV65_12485 [Armatimonadota bacterium]